MLHPWSGHLQNNSEISSVTAHFYFSSDRCILFTKSGCKCVCPPARNHFSPSQPRTATSPVLCQAQSHGSTSERNKSFCLFCSILTHNRVTDTSRVGNRCLGGREEEAPCQEELEEIKENLLTCSCLQKSS